MKTPSLQLQLAKHIQALSGEQVKTLILQWLLTSDATVAKLNQQLMATVGTTPLEIMETAGFIGCFEAESNFSQQSEEILRSFTEPA
jgi:hypothetical protein